ncbi:phage tailspike protein [Escherichia coli]
MTDITANVVVSMPSQLFTMARSFKAVANGKIYIGKIDTDPVNPENQIQVYVENEDGSHVPVSQPIIINAAGYPVYNGQIAKFVTVQGHSMAVYDAYGSQQFYFPNVLKYDPDQFEQRLASADTGMGDSLLAVKQPYTGAVKITQHDKNAQVLHVSDFGAIGDGVADDTAALQAALNAKGIVRLGYSRYRITAQLTVGAQCVGIEGEGMYTSVIVKDVDADAIKCDTSGALLSNFGIESVDGKLGGGIRPRGYNILIDHVRVTGTSDSPILVEGAIGSNAKAATYLHVDSCILIPADSTVTHSIRSIGADESARPTCRVFSNLSGGSSLPDFSGMNYAVLENSLGGIMKFDENSSKIIIKGIRVTNSIASIIIKGNDHVIDDNIWSFGAGFALSIDVNARNVFFGPNNSYSQAGSALKSIIDPTPIGGLSTNILTTQLVTYPFSWFASTTNPTIGNAKTYAYYKRSGMLCYATLGMLRGSSSTNGTGEYTFQLPFKSYVLSIGSGYIKSSSGVYYPCSAVVLGGQSLVRLYINGASGAFNDSSVALQTGAEIRISIEYLISPI